MTAASLVQHLVEGDSNGVTTTSTVLSPSSKTVTVGNWIIVCVSGTDAMGAGSAVDNLGNTYSSVENTSTALAKSTMLRAPVTVGGSLTSITVTHTTSRFRSWQAIEIAAGSFVEAGGGTAQAGGADPSGIVSKTIPAGGIGVWFTAGNTTQTYAQGDSTGTPSTAPTVIQTHSSGNMSNAISYVLGGSGITGFTGGHNVDETGGYASVGAIFDSIPDAAGDPHSLGSLRSLQSLRSL